MEWINPKYAELVAAMQRAQSEVADDDLAGEPVTSRPVRVRGFILPSADAPPGPLG